MFSNFLPYGVVIGISQWIGSRFIRIAGSDKKVIVIGNEANGVETNIQDMADEKIKIPMLGKTESLNASVATGVVLYEYVRQKLT